MERKKKNSICGAKARSNNHQPCKKSPMKNGRCYLHGGPSKGPKSTEGRRRSAMANYKHGLYTNDAIAERKRIRKMIDWRDDLDESFTSQDKIFIHATE